MAASPVFTATPKIGARKLVTANANRDGSGTILDVFTAGALGSKIEEIVLKADGNPADSTVVIYLHDGSTYFTFDEWDIGDPAAGSTTVASYRESRLYDNLVLPNGWKLTASITVAPTAGNVVIIALGGDF